MTPQPSERPDPTPDAPDDETLARIARTRAAEAERELTTSLVALEHKAKRAAEAAQLAMTPLAIGAIATAGLAALAGAVLLVRRSRRRGGAGILGAIVRAALARVAVGVATTVGAQLAERVIVPAMRERMGAARARGPRRRARARNESDARARPAER